MANGISHCLSPVAEALAPPDLSFLELCVEEASTTHTSVLGKIEFGHLQAPDSEATSRRLTSLLTVLPKMPQAHDAKEAKHIADALLFTYSVPVNLLPGSENAYYAGLEELASNNPTVAYHFMGNLSSYLSFFQNDMDAVARLHHSLQSKKAQVVGKSLSETRHQYNEAVEAQLREKLKELPRNRRYEEQAAKIRSSFQPKFKEAEEAADRDYGQRAETAENSLTLDREQIASVKADLSRKYAPYVMGLLNAANRLVSYFTKEQPSAIAGRLDYISRQCAAAYGKGKLDEALSTLRGKLSQAELRGTLRLSDITCGNFPGLK